MYFQYLLLHRIISMLCLCTHFIENYVISKLTSFFFSQSYNTMENEWMFLQLQNHVKTFIGKELNNFNRWKMYERKKNETKLPKINSIQFLCIIARHHYVGTWNHRDYDAVCENTFLLCCSNTSSSSSSCIRLIFKSRNPCKRIYISMYNEKAF